jgi:beta-galactosidase
VAVYHKKSIWNTYQEETYRLSKRLTGITSIAFLLRSKIHLKGFYFKKIEKAYEQLSVLSYDMIYGDAFTLQEDRITGIGNNVTVTFDGMDFGVEGISRLFICGRSLIACNSIQIRFHGTLGETKQLAEFSYSPEYTVREFPMEKITGNQSVSFLFLPGCNFDFQWFRFE